VCRIPAPTVLSDVYRSLQAELGEEDAGYTFENGPCPLEHLDVMVHRETATDDLVFATIGMSVAAMPAWDSHRAELRLYRRSPLAPREQELLAIPLANLAGCPWNVGQPLGWGEVVSSGEEIPAFGGCRSVFLAGPWRNGQPGHLETSAGAVRVINVVPITEAERAKARATQPTTFFNDLLDARDILQPPVDDLAAE
jgi:Suppressor of fused protein (SUFU)